MAGVAKLFKGNSILNKSKQQIDLNDEQFQGKIFGLYFSAHWCPPCRGFTPVLTQFYNLHHDEKKFEIIFVSSDRDQEAFDEYYGEMPWLALNYQERKKKDELSTKYEVEGIPMLILLDGDSGEIVCPDARNHIQSEDTNGDHFPWKSPSSQEKKTKKCCILL